MTVVVNDVALNALLRSPAGPVGRDLQRRAFQVQAQARQNASGSVIGIDTGDLLGGIFVSFSEDVDGLRATVGTVAKHEWKGHPDYAYPAFHDRTGRPWLTRALAVGLHQ